MEDYERANAREWDMHYNERQTPDASASSWEVVGCSKRTETLPQRPSPQKWKSAGGPMKTTRPRRLPPKMTLDSDNEGQQAWRNHEPPKETIQIPDELALQDKSHTVLARHHGTFIFSGPGKGYGGFMVFSIWGDAAAVTATKQAINGWIEEWRSSRKSDRSSKFAKVVSLTPKLRERAEKKWERDVKRAKYRQYPPPNLKFGAIGSFHWPVDEYRPEEILGMSFEALDPIRMDCSCYVLYVKDRSMFQVIGKSEDVRTGLLRLRGTCFQIAARQISPIRLYLLHWPEAASLPSHVYFDPYEQLTHISENLAADTKTGWSPRADGCDPDNGRLETQMGLSEERVRNTILQTLRKLHYYRGNIQMRIRLGTFLATQYKVAKDGMYELDEYESMLGASQFIGQVTEEIGEKEMGEAALAALQNANELLTPQDAMTHELVDVKPIYSAILTFADEAGDLRLSMSWEEAQDASSKSSTFEIVSTKWTRLERDTGAAYPILDISLSNLNTGMAWQFDIQGAQAVEESRLPSQLANFAHNVRIDAKEARKATPDKSFIIHKPYAGHLKSIQQRVSYRYGLSASDYTLELSRFQTRTYPPRKSIALPPDEPTVYEARWSLNVHRIEWDKEFTKNERLPIGEKADWDHDVDTWFPEDIPKTSEESAGAGFGQLMEKLKKIAKLVREAREEDLMGGMTVG